MERRLKAVKPKWLTTVFLELKKAKNNMESPKVYFINIMALFTTNMNMNETLQTIVLGLTIFYTGINIIKQLKNGKN